MSAVPATGHGHGHTVGRDESNLAPNFVASGPAMGFVGLAGALISVALMAMPQHSGFMLNSWLLSFMFWILITLGCFGLNLLYYSVKGSWVAGVLRITEAGGSGRMFLVFLGLLVPVFVAILANRSDLYEWVGHTAGDPILMKKAAYLNVPGFIGRSIIFLLFWAGLAHFLRRSSLRSDVLANSEDAGDRQRNRVEEQWRSNLGTAALPFFVLTLTFAVTDWGMSLTPHWSSTMYGPLLMISGALGAYSLAALLVCVNARRRPFLDYVAPNFTKDLGNMTFVFTMLWAYFSVSQLIIIWNGNLPEFASYYARRSTDGWNVTGMMTIIGQFIVPFLVLNTPRVKRYPERLARILGWVFVIHIVDVYQIIGRALPTRPWASSLPTAYDGLAFITIGAIWFAVLASVAKKAPLMALFDRRLEEAKHSHH